VDCHPDAVRVLGEKRAGAEIGVFKCAQKRTAQIRQTIDGCERFIFAIAQCRIDQTSSSHEPHLPISLSIPDSEKAMPLLVSRDQEFMYVR
jgi:hypothetical protein